MKQTDKNNLPQPEQAQEQAQSATQPTSAETIKELQETTCKALNDLLAALKAERYKVNDIISLFGFVIEASKDEDYNLHFQPRDLTHANCIRYGSREDTDSDADEAEETPQRPQPRTEPLDVNANKNRRTLGGKVTGGSK